jgi:putative thioredoxin
VPLARLLLARGDADGALALAREVPGSFAADGLVARIGLMRRPPTPEQPDLTDAFAALDAGDHARALDLLIGALPSADGARDDIRRVVVGILDELGVDSQLARESRRRLATALY